MTMVEIYGKMISCMMRVDCVGFSSLAAVTIEQMVIVLMPNNGT